MRYWGRLQNSRERQADQLHRHAQRDSNGKCGFRGMPLLVICEHLISLIRHFFVQNCILCDYSVVRANCRLKKCTPPTPPAFVLLPESNLARCSVGERYQIPDDKKSENAVFVVESMASEGGSLRRMTFDRESFGPRGGSLHEL
jgi:hypothetical protein